MKDLNAFAAAVLLGSTAIAPFAYAQDATAPAAGTQAPATGTEAPAVAPMTDTANAAATTPTDPAAAIDHGCHDRHLSTEQSATRSAPTTSSASGHTSR
jgi:hypothetical protein